MNQTEEQLVKKAIKVIDQHGYHNLSLRKLTAAIGLTTGAFYKHFTSKDDLFKQATAVLSHDFIIKINFTSQHPEEQLLQIADYFVNQVQKHPNIMDFLFFNSQATIAFNESNDHYPFLKKMHQLINQIELKSGLSNDEFFIQIWSFIQGYAFLIKNGITTYNQQLVQTTLTQLIKGAK